MSCPHGNHVDACELCDEVDASYKAGLAEGLRQQAEQAEDSRCPTTYRREGAVKTLIGLGWKWDGQQWQVEQACGVVSDGWDDEAYANMAGKLDSWKRRALQAERFIEHEVQGQTFMGEPLIHRPQASAEQGGRVDEGMASALGLMLDAFNYPSIDRSPEETEAIRAAIAALTQNANGEVWGYVGQHELRIMGEMGYAQVLDTPLPAVGITTPVYLHAERARVPDGWVLVPREPTEEMIRIGAIWRRESPDVDPTVRNECTASNSYRAMLAAAPSQGEAS